MEHKHDAGFIPKYLLEDLAKQGNKDAKKTLVQMEKIEEKAVEAKKKIVNDFSAHANNTATKRFIYDSENTEQYQRKLIRSEDEPPVQDDVVNITYDFCGKTLDYLKQKLNHNSIDGRGMDVICNVHYGIDFNNARWVGDQLALGDGDGRTFINLARSIDVVAHEMAHGVTQFVNDLKYFRQSGALNEHFSDVFGTAVQQYVKGQTAQTADWLIGDEVVAPSFQGKAIRSMKEPGTAYEGDRQVAHMSEYRVLPEEDDDGGVHYFSGIPNRAFFLTAMEIGTDSAAFLWYTALHDHGIIHYESSFLDAFKAILKAAESLVQQGKLPQTTIAAVKSAFAEVGINAAVSV